MAGESIVRGLFIGLSTYDVIQYVNGFPSCDGKTTSVTKSYAGGGPALNAAVVFAALGGKPTLVTCLGKGPIAHLIRQDLEQQGVMVKDASLEGFTPPLSSIIVHLGTGQRQVISPDGTGAQDGKHLVLDDFDDQEFQIVHLDGHYPFLSCCLLPCFRDEKIRVVADAGRWKEHFVEILPYVSDLVASADFAIPTLESRLTDEAGWTYLNNSYGIEFVAQTAGGQPIRYWDIEQTREESVAVSLISPVCTIGAGDFFHGAYVYHLARYPRSSAVQHLTFAAKVAALKCVQTGTRNWLNSAEFQRLRKELL